MLSFNTHFIKLRNRALTFKKFLLFLTQRAQSDTVLRVASSLSYTSLIALVPLFAIGLVIFSAFPIFSDLREQLQNLLLHTVAYGFRNDMKTYFDTVVLATGKLTAVGVVGIAITAILLLSTIENSLNFIFKVRKPRGIKTKITLYWTVITLGPLLLGAGFSMRGYVYALKRFMPDAILANDLFFSAIVPSLLTISALVLLYILVPNRKVSIAHSFIGATIAMLLFYILRTIFSTFLASTNTYNAFYGAMAIIPIMLIWLYLVWAAVIFGAVVTAAIGDFLELEQEKIQALQKSKDLQVFDYGNKSAYKKKHYYNKKYLPKEQK